MSNNRNSIEPLLPRSNNDQSLSQQEEEEEYQPTAPLANMGVTLSTARVIAPASFVIDFLCQIYGMAISNPNMKQVNDKHVASFSPHPFAIVGFFNPQQIIQLLWLRELFRPDAQVERGTVRYAPWYALGNLCIAAWMFAWNSENMKVANALVTLNTLTQVYYVFALRNKNANTWQTKLTNIVNITFAGIGLLDLLHNGSVAYFPGVAPNTLTKVATAITAPLTALVSPLLFGSCVAYDMLGVAVGQHSLAQKSIGGLGGGGGEGWAKFVGAVGLATAGVVGARAFGGAKWL